MIHQVFSEKQKRHVSMCWTASPTERDRSRFLISMPQMKFYKVNGKKTSREVAESLIAISDHLEVSARPNTSAESETEAASPYNDRHRQQSRRNAKKTKIIAREVADYVFQSFLFLPEELQEWKSIMRRPRRLKGVGFRKTRLFVGQPREKWSCCHCQSNDDLRSSACPSQSDFDTRLS